MAFAHVRKSGRGRFYNDPNGKAYWSVTTILQGVPKPALMYWSAKSVAEYALDNWRAVAQVKNRDRDAALQLLKNSPWREAKKKADVGTAVHAAIEAYILGKPWPEPEEQEVIDLMVGFQKFLADRQPEFLASELVVYNPRQVYAGTLDAIVLIDDAWVVLDTKTGKGVYEETALQLAAYRHAEFYESSDGTMQELPRTDGAAVLHLQYQDYELIPVRSDAEVFEVFKFAREIFRWLNETSKDVIDNPAPAGQAPIWKPRSGVPAGVA